MGPGRFRIIYFWIWQAAFGFGGLGFVKGDRPLSRVSELVRGAIGVRDEGATVVVLVSVRTNYFEPTLGRRRKKKLGIMKYLSDLCILSLFIIKD